MYVCVCVIYVHECGFVYECVHRPPHPTINIVHDIIHSPSSSADTLWLAFKAVRAVSRPSPGYYLKHHDALHSSWLPPLTSSFRVEIVIFNINSYLYRRETRTCTQRILSACTNRVKGIRVYCLYFRMHKWKKDLCWRFYLRVCCRRSLTFRMCSEWTKMYIQGCDKRSVWIRIRCSVVWQQKPLCVRVKYCCHPFSVGWWANIWMWGWRVINVYIYLTRLLLYCMRLLNIFYQNDE